ncbi:hypothetical protein [Flavipsychrobacter stenotrophus]|nr:hypothetical protein [Flavipsychrobacter stenotrophus]
MDSKKAALTKRRNKIYSELQSEEKKLAAPCSTADSIIINSRIDALRDSIYECRKAAEDIDVFWINNK